MDLSELRTQIDAIDEELVKLFCARMEVSAKVADYKKANHLPIHHPVREQEVLEKVGLLAEPELTTYAQTLYAEIFRLSRDYQAARNSEVTE